eukprot:CAMPEP_0202915828 /NCGR_PEP_ID=MMETSP1392-20130828/66824_1 /ASSEMBLY_ACC=CAM_ASM_000868 /TAXON_ID=225041 /ORGANISM="Chlamydomonas chlamydogama, Strain SAG 11-48b" /LENGTH=74 /DNA_ID=CAMNT_0049608013 /DNA_START=42 /DNA_END=263 /DNA_ORIENTATION=+
MKRPTIHIDDKLQPSKSSKRKVVSPCSSNKEGTSPQSLQDVGARRACSAMLQKALEEAGAHVECTGLGTAIEEE